MIIYTWHLFFIWYLKTVNRLFIKATARLFIIGILFGYVVVSSWSLWIVLLCQNSSLYWNIYALCNLYMLLWDTYYMHFVLNTPSSSKYSITWRFQSKVDTLQFIGFLASAQRAWPLFIIAVIGFMRLWPRNWGSTCFLMFWLGGVSWKAIY